MIGRKISRGGASALFAAALLLSAGVTSAAEADEAIRKKAELCVACHGPDGNSIQPAIPSLAGQPKQFITTQLVMFREGRRINAQMAPFVANYDAGALSYRWTAADPAVDTLQGELAALVEAGTAAGDDVQPLFTRLRALVHAASNLPSPGPVGSSTPGPRLSEAWFCCAEPTALQRAPLPLPVLAQGGASD